MDDLRMFSFFSHRKRNKGTWSSQTSWTFQNVVKQWQIFELLMEFRKWKFRGIGEFKALHSIFWPTDYVRYRNWLLSVPKVNQALSKTSKTHKMVFQVDFLLYHGIDPILLDRFHDSSHRQINDISKMGKNKWSVWVFINFFGSFWISFWWILKAGWKSSSSDQLPKHSWFFRNGFLALVYLFQTLITSEIRSKWTQSQPKWSFWEIGNNLFSNYGNFHRFNVCWTNMRWCCLKSIWF